MKTKQLLIFAAAVLAVISIVVTPAAQAQAVYGGIIGTVTDPQGAAVANAKVTVTDEGRGTSETTTTNESGNYSVTHLIAGTYTVRAEGTGFKTTLQKGVIVNVDANANVPLQFQVGGTSETVEVTGEAPQLKTESAEQQHCEACLVATGQFTTCYNLLEYIDRLLDKSTGTPYADKHQNRLLKLKAQMLEDYEHFKTDPFFLFNASGTGYNIPGFKPLTMTDIPFPENWKEKKEK